MSFTSKRTLTEKVNPPKPNGVIAPNPYKDYQLVTDHTVPAESALRIWLRRWRTVSTSELYDSWERVLVDGGAIALVCVVIMLIFHAIKGLF